MRGLSLYRGRVQAEAAIPAISARGLTKRFGKVVALEALDLDVARGEALGVLGPSGSGKSTFVRMLAGLVRPSGGSLSVDGAPASSIASRRRLGVLTQDAELYGWATARETLAFAGDVAGMGATAIAARIDELAPRFSLTDVLDRRVAALPASVRGRLAIAQALVASPEILVLDEPFHRLDPDERAVVVEQLRGLRGATTIVLAAHRPADITTLCDRVAVLEGGRLARTSTVERPNRGASAAAPEDEAGALDWVVAWLMDLVRGALRRRDDG